MRTNIDIDDELMKEALTRTGSKTKKEVVDMALRMLVQIDNQAEIRLLKGKVKWKGDLSRSRRSRV